MADTVRRTPATATPYSTRHEEASVTPDQTRPPEQHPESAEVPDDELEGVNGGAGAAGLSPNAPSGPAGGLDTC